LSCSIGSKSEGGGLGALMEKNSKESQDLDPEFGILLSPLAGGFHYCRFAVELPVFLLSRILDPRQIQMFGSFAAEALFE
jgi:hypothetical protein